MAGEALEGPGERYVRMFSVPRGQTFDLLPGEVITEMGMDDFGRMRITVVGIGEQPGATS